MKLVDLIAQQTGTSHNEIVLFRHANKDVEIIERFHASLEEWTSIQPVGTRYDYWDQGKTKILVVIVRNQIFGVYRVIGIAAEGPLYSISSEALNAANRARRRENGPHRRFDLQRVDSEVTALSITGWEGKEINPVARSRGTLFWEVAVVVNSDGHE